MVIKKGLPTRPEKYPYLMKKLPEKILQKGIQTEADASYLYTKLAEHEKNDTLAEVFVEMSKIERGHAKAFAEKEGLDLIPLLKPSWRAKTIDFIGRIFGYDYVLGTLLDTEKNISKSILFLVI